VSVLRRRRVGWVSLRVRGAYRARGQRARREAIVYEWMGLGSCSRKVFLFPEVYVLILLAIRGVCLYLQSLAGDETYENELLD